LHETTSYEPSCVKISSVVFPVEDGKKKKERHKKSRKRYISPIRGEAPRKRIFTKFRTSGDIIIIIIDNRGLNTRWCLTPLFFWHQISFVLLLYGQRIDTHLTDPPLGTDGGFPLVFNHCTNEAQFIRPPRRRSR